MGTGMTMLFPTFLALFVPDTMMEAVVGDVNIDRMAQLVVFCNNILPCHPLGNNLMMMHQQRSTADVVVIIEQTHFPQ